MWVRSLTWATLRPARWRASARTSPIATTYPHCSSAPRTIPDNAARRPDSPLPDARCATVIRADVAVPAIVAADDQHPVPSLRARVSHRRQHHALVAETGDLTHTVHHRDAHADHLPPGTRSWGPDRSYRADWHQTARANAAAQVSDSGERNGSRSLPSGAFRRGSFTVLESSQCGSGYGFPYALVAARDSAGHDLLHEVGHAADGPGCAGGHSHDPAVVAAEGLPEFRDGWPVQGRLLPL